MKIVIIDDEFIVVEGMKAIFDRLKLDVTLVGSADNGVDGCRLIREQKPDIVVTDIRMPGLDGLSMIETVRKEFPDIYFVVISGYTDFSYAQKAIQIGVCSYLDKPITLEQVEEAFSQIMQKEDRKKRADLNDTGDDAVINALLLEDTLMFQKALQQYVIHLQNKYTDFGKMKEKAYRFLCFLVEVYHSQKSRKEHVLWIPCHKVMQMESQEELRFFIMEVGDKMVSMLEAEKVDTDNRQINLLLEYISSNYSKDIGLSDLADVVNLNPAYISNLFKDTVGESYSKYITSLRMKKARELLLDGVKVGEVSEMVGYNNYRYFCNLFKKSTGMTPNEFRCTQSTRRSI